MVTNERYVEVEWYDAVSRNTWWSGDPDARPKPLRCVTRGWVVYEDNQGVVVCGTFTDDGDWGETICIPTGLTTKIRDLTVE